MQKEIRYIEHKNFKLNNFNNGEAIIGWVELSKGKKWIKFGEKKFSKSTGEKFSNYQDEYGEPYWVSGVKKRGSNRHPCSTNGKIKIQRSAVEEFLRWRKEEKLDIAVYEVIEG